MSKDLFIAKLPLKTTPEELRQMFSRAGEVTFVKRPRDFETGEYRAFAFVSMATEEQGLKAIEMFNGHVLDGVTIAVKVSDKPIVTTPTPRPAASPPPVKRPTSPTLLPQVSFKWDDRLEQVEPLLDDLGTATTAKLVLVGRPLNHAMHANVVMVALQNFLKQTGLPKGLPAPPAIPVNYVVYMTKKAWDKVHPLLEENESDALVIEGFLTLDVELGAVAVIATNVGTKFQKRQPESQS